MVGCTNWCISSFLCTTEHLFTHKHMLHEKYGCIYACMHACTHADVDPSDNAITVRELVSRSALQTAPSVFHPEKSAGGTKVQPSWFAARRAKWGERDLPEGRPCGCARDLKWPLMPFRPAGRKSHIWEPWKDSASKLLTRSFHREIQNCKQITGLFLRKGTREQNCCNKKIISMLQKEKGIKKKQQQRNEGNV